MFGMTFAELVRLADRLRRERPVRAFVVTPYGYEAIKDVAIEEELQAMLSGHVRSDDPIASLTAIPIRVSTQYPPALLPGEVFLDVGRRDSEGC